MNMNSITLGTFKFRWPLAVCAVLWRAEGSLDRIDRVHLMTEPSLSLRAGLPVHDGWWVMDASLSWQFPSGKQVVRPLDPGKPDQPLILTSSESGRLSYSYSPGSFHPVGGMPAALGLCLVALGIVLLPFINDIKPLFRCLPGGANFGAFSRRR